MASTAIIYVRRKALMDQGEKSPGFHYLSCRTSFTGLNIRCANPGCDSWIWTNRWNRYLSGRKRCKRQWQKPSRNESSWGWWQILVAKGIAPGAFIDFSIDMYCCNMTGAFISLVYDLVLIEMAAFTILYPS